MNNFSFVEIKKLMAKFALEKSFDYMYRTMTQFHKLLLMAPYFQSSFLWAW